MRVHYLSDLHLEFGRHEIRLPEGDVLVLAGDITVAASLSDTKRDLRSVKTRERSDVFFAQAREKFKHVFYIAGNHEHYNGDITTTGNILRQRYGSPQVQFLENEAVELGGITFLCCTLWTNMGGRDAEVMYRVGMGLQDFHIVANGERRFTTSDAADIHEASVAWLRREIDARARQMVVVVTHHAPSLQGLASGFAENRLDGGFASDLEEMAWAYPQINSWIFGHTHIRRTFRVNETIFRANCAGYPGTELLGFDADTWFSV